MKKYKKSLILIIAIFMFAGCFNNTEKDKNDSISQKKETKKNYVKMITYIYNAYTNSYNNVGYYSNEYDSEGKLIKEGSYDAQGTIGAYKTYEYNKNGNLVKDIFCNGNGDGQVNEYTTYEYDENKKLNKKVANYIQDERMRVNIYEYDGKGNLLKDTETDTEKNSTNPSILTKNYEYNNNGQIEKCEILYNLSIKVSYCLYKYDEKGNIVNTTDYECGNNRINESYTYEYDMSGKKVKSTYINGRDNSFSSYSIYEYNSEQMIKETWYSLDGNIRGYSVYEY